MGIDRKGGSDVQFSTYPDSFLVLMYGRCPPGLSTIGHCCYHDEVFWFLGGHILHGLTMRLAAEGQAYEF